MLLRSSFLIVSASLACGAWLGHADDLWTSGGGARTKALAGAYLPSSDNPLDAIAINPAGLAELSGPSFELSLAGVFARGDFTNRANPSGRLDSNGALPSIGFGTPIGNSRVSIGAAILPDYIGASKWRYNDTPGGIGGVSYGPLRPQADILAVRGAFGVGIYLGARLQVGATFGATYNQNRLSTAYVFQNTPMLAGLKTMLDLRTDGIGWNGTFGILAEPAKRLQLGVSYATRTAIASEGRAIGNAGVQFAAIGLGAISPAFRYNARVETTLPQSITAHLAYFVNPRTRLVAQTDWINWKDSFVALPIKLTEGTNAAINGLLGSASLQDSVPLQWRDQIAARVGVERSWLENATLRAGYAHSNDPVPSSTLTPLNAAIIRNTLSTGIGYRHERWRIDAAYSLDLRARQDVGDSLIKSGEYSNSAVRLGTQSITLTTSLRFR